MAQACILPSWIGLGARSASRAVLEQASGRPSGEYGRNKRAAEAALSGVSQPE
jgi:hypothetical protein